MNWQLGKPRKVDGQWLVDVTYPAREAFCLWRWLRLDQDQPEKTRTFATGPQREEWRNELGQRASLGLELRLKAYLGAWLEGRRS